MCCSCGCALAVAMAEAEERMRVSAAEGVRDMALSRSLLPDQSVRGWEALKHALWSLVERPAHPAGQDAATPA